MNRTLICAALALALGSTTTAGAAPACATDPADDVVVTTGFGLAAVPADRPHLDIRRYTVSRTARDLTVVIQMGGRAGTGTWRMDFEYDRSYGFSLMAQNVADELGRDPRVAVGAEFGAEVIRWTSQNGVRIGTSRSLPGVTGSFTADGALRVHVPLAGLGKATPKRGARARVTWLSTYEDVAVVGAYRDFADCAQDL